MGLGTFLIFGHPSYEPCDHHPNDPCDLGRSPIHSEELLLELGQHAKLHGANRSLSAV